MNTYLYFARIDTTVNSTSSTGWAKVCFKTILRSSEGGKQSRFEQQWTHTPHQDYYHGVRISVCHHISCHHISLSRVPRIGAIYRCCWGQEQAWNPRLDYDKITIEQDVRLGIIINFRAEEKLMDNMHDSLLTRIPQWYSSTGCSIIIEHDLEPAIRYHKHHVQSRLVTRQARRDTHVCQRH